MTMPVNNKPVFNPALPVQNKANAASRPDNKKLEAACRDFESIFVNYMMQKMRDTVPEDEMFGGGQAEKIYSGMLDSEVAKSVSHQRGIGLAAIMYAQLSSVDENENTTK